MSTRSRRRTAPSEEEPLDDEFSFISDDDIEAFMASQEIEEEAEAKAGFWNLQTASGMALIGLGAVYSMQLAGLLSIGSGALVALVQVLPIFAAILIMLSGFGVLSWSPAARRQRKARARAARRRSKQRAQQRKTMGRQQRRQQQMDEVGRRASQAFSQAERAVRAATEEARKRSSSSRTRRSHKNRSSSSRRLVRLRSQRKISGVAAGIADYFGLDPTIVRIAFVIAAIASQGAAFVLYLILSMALPADDTIRDDDDPVIQILDD